MIASQETIAALATPVGTAALAVVRVSGPGSAGLARRIFSKEPHPRVSRHADYRSLSGELLDDVVYTFYAGPRSYTGEDALEISCHGNPFIAQRILEDLFARGCRAAAPGEFTQRAFLGGRIDLSQAEAVMDVIHARSERALAVAQQQLRGALGRKMAALIDELVDALARTEAYIDFPDEDLPAEDRGLVGQMVASVLRGTDELLATSHYGELLRDGVRTVIIGEPNAGKSSLLNRLVGEERALVSAEPGTTRDYIEARLLLGGHCLRLIDTAGLNALPQPLERLGIAKTLEQASVADLFLVVLDVAHPAFVLPESLAGHLRADNTLVVLNKVDLLPEEGQASDLPACLGGFPQIRVSALSGAGFPVLEAAVVRAVDAFQRQVGGEAIAINARHAGALAEARSRLRAVLAQLQSSGAVELLASDMRGALDALGEISGRVDNERMLDRLFSTFCIGK